MLATCEWNAMLNTECPTFVLSKIGTFLQDYSKISVQEVKYMAGTADGGGAGSAIALPLF